MIYRILANTPIWVFALFALLLVFGFKQTRSRNVRKLPAYLLPIGMIVLSLAGVQSSFGFKPVPIAFWAVGLAIVTFAGYRFFSSGGVTFDRRSNSFFISGSWIPFAVIMAIFFAKYAFTVVRAISPNTANSQALAISLSLVYGCLSGYFAARAANLLASTRTS